MMIAIRYPNALSKPTSALSTTSRHRCSCLSSVMVKKVMRLKAIEATPSSFKEYGQVVGPSPDGAEYGPQDAQLELHRGTPRFYIMHLEDRKLSFDRITHHANVTQCLGSVGGRPWYLGVARPSIVRTNESEGHKSEDIEEAVKDSNSAYNADESTVQFQQGKVLLSNSGHCFIPPAPEDVQVFRVEGPQFLKLHVGTWHAGPLFENPSMDFYNLELSNTNVVDHTTHVFSEANGIGFMIED